MTEKIALSVEEAAEALGICSKKVYEMTHISGFPAIKVGKRTLISRAGLEKWLLDQVEEKTDPVSCETHTEA